MNTCKFLLFVSKSGVDMEGLKYKVPGHTLFSQQGFDNGDNSKFLKSVTVIIENVKKKATPRVLI